MSSQSPTPVGTGARPSLLGQRVERLEDDRLLGGRASYIADVRLPGMVEAAFVRSQLAHARIRGVDLDAARAHPGVLMAVAAADLEGVSPVPDFPHGARPVAAFPLCRERARYVGAPIAVVVAADRYLAEDAAELVVPDLEALPVLSTMDQALAPDAPRLFEDWPDNTAIDDGWPNADAQEAFSRLRVIGGEYTMHRHAAMPMEGRGVIAEYRDERLTVWSSTQFAHMLRTMLSYVLGIPERTIRVISPDVGGGFGGKAQIYPEEYVIPWLAMRLGRPVRWIEDRYEHLVAACHARDMRIRLEAAIHEDGRIEALRGRILHDVGAVELYPSGCGPGLVAYSMLTGPYRIPNQDVRVTCVATNKTPTGAYRGFGIPEAAFAIERLIDRIAGELDLDPLALRRSMMLERHDLPYTTASGARIDSGSHREAFDLVVELGKRALEQERARIAGDDRRRVGLGVASYIEGTADSYYMATGHWTSQDAADIRFDPGGGVTAAVGISAFGQGTRTMVATLVAEELALPIDQIRVVMDDTDTSPYGLGGWSSRGAVVIAGAIGLATDQIRTKAQRIAAQLLEAATDDVELRDGGWAVRGSPTQVVTWKQVAEAALVRTFELPEGLEAGLEAAATYDPPGLEHVPDALGRQNGATTYTNSTHAAVVEVDLDTGVVRVVRYVVGHDCGRVINPMTVAGQVHGGVAQGIGGALYEDIPYDASGAPQATTFMEYLVPTAVEIPPIELEEMESPAPETAFGVKGAGEAGIIGPAPSIARAVEDALAEFAVPEIVETPITPSQVLSWISDSARAGAGG